MKRLPLSLDVLLLLVLVPAQVQIAKTKPFLLVVPLAVYLLLELWHPIGQYRIVAKSGRLHWVFLARLMLLFVMIAGATIIPTLENIGWRLAVPADSNGYTPALEGIQDGALQVELALQYTSHGKNPYAERYDATPMKYYSLSNVDVQGNPYASYFIYLPGLLLVSSPPFALSQWVGFPFDERWVTLIAYAALVFFLPLLVQPPEHKLLMLAAIGLHPLLTVPVIFGMNDVIIVLLLVLTILALSQKHPWLAAMWLGAACAIKQSAWFLLPFYFLYLFRWVEPSQRLRQVLSSAAIIGAVMLIVTAPLALWNLPAFVMATILYPLGLTGVNVPIRGYTVGILLRGAGMIPSYTASFPFWILQGFLGIPLLAATLRYQWKRNSLGILFICAGVFGFGLGLVSRIFHDNYVGFMTVLIAIGAILQAGGESPPDTTISDLSEPSGMRSEPAPADSILPVRHPAVKD